MGLMDYIKTQLIEIIEWQDDSRDTISWRFVSRSRGGSCTQMPITLRYVDSIPSQPARSVHIKVEQRGTPLRRTVTLPLGRSGPSSPSITIV